MRLVENPGNRGKGYSVRNGMLNACGRSSCSATPTSLRRSKRPTNFSTLWTMAPTSPSAPLARAEIQTQRQPLHRQLFGRIFNLLLRVTLGLHFKTRNADSRLSPNPPSGHLSSAANRTLGIRSRNSVSRRKPEFKVQEVPVAWGHSEGTRIDRWSTAPACSWRCCVSAGTT